MNKRIARRAQFDDLIWGICYGFVLFSAFVAGLWWVAFGFVAVGVLFRHIGVWYVVSAGIAFDLLFITLHFGWWVPLIHTGLLLCVYGIVHLMWRMFRTRSHAYVQSGFISS